MKKSFVLYADQYEVVRELSVPQKAWLLDAMFLFALGENEGAPPDPAAYIAFRFIRQQMQRDAAKYAERAERSRENGKKGGRPSDNPDNPVGLSKTQTNPDKPKKPDTVTDTVTVTVNDTVTYLMPQHASARSPEVTMAFDRVFHDYPSSRRDKRKAFPVFSANGLWKDVDRICECIEAEKRSAEWKRENGRFIPSLDLFLEKRPWEQAKTTSSLPLKADGSIDWRNYKG